MTDDGDELVLRLERLPLAGDLPIVTEDEPLIADCNARHNEDSRRIPDDPSSYARYTIPGLAISWVEVPS